MQWDQCLGNQIFFADFYTTTLDQSNNLSARKKQRWVTHCIVLAFSSLYLSQSKPINETATSAIWPDRAEKSIKPAEKASFAFMFFNLHSQSISKNFHEVSTWWSFRCFVSTDLIQSRLYLSFTLSVQGRCGLIQQEDLGVANQGSSNGDSLFLSATQLGPSLSNQGVKFLQHRKHRRT